MKLINHSHVMTDPHTDDRILNDALADISTSARRQPNIWRTIMKSRITRLTAATVTVIAILLALKFASTPDMACAISDLPGLFRDAKTIHIFGHKYFPPESDSNSETAVAEFEAWIDTENARIHAKYPSRISRNERSVVLHKEFITNGQQILHMNHNDKNASVAALTPDHRDLIVSTNLDGVLRQIFGDPEQVEAYELIGEEDIDETTFYIWKAEVVPDPNEPIDLRIKMWISPGTARIAKLRVWQRAPETNWLPDYEISKIERNVTIPESIFQIQVPQGYSMAGGKGAELRLMSMSSWYFRSAGLEVCPRLILEDGSMVMPWRSFARRFKGDMKGAEQAELIANLEPGGPLPRLPVEIYALKAKNLFGTGTTYLGHHLFCTRKDEKTYEWAIYVAKTKTTNRVSPLGYKPMYRCNQQAVQDEWTMSGWDKQLLHGGIPVTSQNFDTVFLKAVAELSDEDRVPTDLTYDWILQVAEKVRQSLPQ